ncbi:hypothetical protein Tco_1403550 [Tanacetum coccineum]
MTESPLMESCFAIPVFSPRDDPIACLNKAMAFLTAVASLRYPSTNTQLRTSSNPRNHATIQDGRVILQQVQGIQGQSYSGTGYKSNATSSRGNNASVHARIVKCYNCQVEAQEARQILDEEQLAFLADPGVPDGQAAQSIILNNAEVPHSETYLNDMENQSVHAMQDFEQTPAEKANKEHNNESVTAELERYKERVKTFEQHLNIDLNCQEKMIDSQMDDMIREKLALKEQVDSLEQNLSKQIKEKECLLQTFTVFKNESKEKEDKYMENEIDLEKKIKRTLIYSFKWGYQNPVHLKKDQQIKPTLYDGIVMSAKHVAMHVIDDEETLILEEKSRSKILSEDFRKRFTPQQEMDVEHAFWFHIFNPAIESIPPPIKVEVPSELPKVSLVNASLKKLKFHLAQFDSVVKKRITPDAHTKDTCPNAIKLNEKKVAVTPKNKVKKVRFVEPLTSSSNSNQCGSKPTGNKRNDRISQTPSRNMKNKVESQPRKVNKKNYVVKQIYDVDVKHSLLNANTEPICATCKKSLFDGVHDICFLDFVKNVNSRAKSAKKHKKENI